MSAPHKCPLCEGKGKLPEKPNATKDGETTCHGCNGHGIVWEPGWSPPPVTPPTVWPYPQPSYPYYPPGPYWSPPYIVYTDQHTCGPGPTTC